MFLSLFLEVIILIILIGVSNYGYNKGFFGMMATPTKWIICIVLSYAFCQAVGNYFIEPLILSCIENGLYDAIYPVINVISVLISFLMLFFLSRVLITYVVSLVNRILDEGIVKRINKTLGFITAGFIAIIGSVVFVSMAEYLILQGFLTNSRIVSEFTGGPLYRLISSISPL